MKFECADCHKTFLYAAKKTENTYSKVTEAKEQIGTVSIISPVVLSFKETHICPFCQSLNIQEVVEEPKLNPKITALIESPNAEVNARLAEGYEVLEDKIYAKSTICVKREKVKEA